MPALGGAGIRTCTPTRSCPIGRPGPTASCCRSTGRRCITRRRLMLVGDRGQPGQAHQVFVTGVRIVHPRVASVGGQVLHRLQQCSAGCVGDRLATTSSDRSARISESSWVRKSVRSNPCSPRSPNARPCAPSERSPRQASAPLPVRRRPRRQAGYRSNPTKAAVTWVSPEQPC